MARWKLTCKWLDMRLVLDKKARTNMVAVVAGETAQQANL